MGSRILPERQIAPEELDRYLALGYRVAGQAVYTSEYIKLGKREMVSVLPTRLPLTGTSMGRHLRKCKRRNDKRFKAIIGPARLDMREEHFLNMAYFNEKPDKAVEDLSFHILGRRIVTPLIRTWQTRVYDGEHLVATSYFDLGLDSAYSKQGIYDPEYHKHSLGMYTLLLEIDFCRWAGKKWFYPGYVGVETDIFDYKLRLSNSMSYFDFRLQKWLPISNKADLPKPLEEMRSALHKLCAILKERGVECGVKKYNYGDIRYSLRSSADKFVDGPYVLDIGGVKKPTVVTYELTGTHPFGLLELEHRYSGREHPNFLGSADTYMHIARINQRLHYSDNAEAMAAFVLQFLGR
ncbi:MAG: hypothetical protein AAF741_08600 [Bacteroidota bacterium]